MLSEMAAALDNIATKIMDIEQNTTHFLFIDTHPIHVFDEILARRHWPTNDKCSWLKDLKQATRKTNFIKNTFSYMIEDNTHFTQMAPNTETNLWRAKNEGVPYVRAAPRWSPAKLLLLLHKLLVLGCAGLHLSTFYLEFLQKSNKQHATKLQTSMFISAN